MCSGGALADHHVFLREWEEEAREEAGEGTCDEV